MSDEAFAILAPYQEGNIDWLLLWAPGRYTSIQCDLCLMLSPAMFRDLCLEELRQECRALDYSIYHLDGSGAWKHMDALLSIPELSAIQWNPEPAVSSDPLAFAPYLRRVLEAGKKLYLSCSPAQVRPLLTTIPREGVFLSIGCKTEAQAKETLSELMRIGT
jgi:hypothetical protein